MWATIQFKICVLGFYFTQIFAQSLPEVTLKQGVVRGIYDKTVNGRTFMGFLGIPYARPPVRKYRFKEALPAEPWTGVYNAAFEPPPCLQYDHMSYKSRFSIHGNEDCLYINVFTPEVPDGIKKLNFDVIVYIHGGAFMFSSGHLYGPQKLLDKDLVFVSFNYRLGPLGFLSTEDDIVPGNMGLKDQMLALKWVKRNIAAFGGNPKSITITGMSAGGSSVHYHMLSPMSKGLFDRVISMSGTALCPWSQTENAKEKAFIIGNLLGCPPDNSTILVECLRSRPADQVVGATKIFMPWLYNPFSPFGPVVEKGGPRPFIDRPPIEIIKTGVVSDVPLLMSFTLHEGLYPAAEIICSDKLDQLNKEWSKLAPYLLDYVYTAPPNQLNIVSREVWRKYVGEKEEAKIHEIVQMLGERLFTADIVKTALLQSSTMSSPIYLYNFTYSGKISLSDAFCNPDEKYGVSHGDDLAYIINMKFLPPVQEDGKRMQDSMVELWTNFAAEGKPKFGTIDKEWPSVKEFLPQLAFVNINSTLFSHIQLVDKMDYIEFWDSLGLKENLKSAQTSLKDEL